MRQLTCHDEQITHLVVHRRCTAPRVADDCRPHSPQRPDRCLWIVHRLFILCVHPRLACYLHHHRHRLQILFAPVPHHYRLRQYHVAYCLCYHYATTHLLLLLHHHHLHQHHFTHQSYFLSYLYFSCFNVHPPVHAHCLFQYPHG